MRPSGLLGCLLGASLLVFGGCGKSPQTAAAGAPPAQMIDASKFRPAFENASPEIKAQVNKVMLALGASDYVGALSELETLTNTSGLTDAQKQVATDLSQQLQKKLASTPPSQ